MRIDVVAPRLVELAPNPLERGVLYISQKYSVAVHLCCCGCGEKVVTPLSPAEWQLHINDGAATLHPSIGSSTPCRSHYWVKQNRVMWVPKMTTQQICIVHSRDRASLNVMYTSRQPSKPRLAWLGRVARTIKAAWDRLQGRR